MFNSHPNHEPALFKIHSGQLLPGLPSLGAWVVYGLGSENQNLPAYVVLDDPQSALPANGVQNWQSGYLPPLYQGTRMRADRFADSQPAAGGRRTGRGGATDAATCWRGSIGSTRSSAGAAAARRPDRQLRAGGADADCGPPTPWTSARRPKATQQMYGIGEPDTDNYARRCLMARRLIERGVRFVQLYHSRPGLGQPHEHRHVAQERSATETDKPVAALLKDLKQRGLLDDTLVVWGGEFGRLPIAQMKPGSDPAKAGRDHGPAGFSIWMAGGGIRSRAQSTAPPTRSATAPPRTRVSVADWHATILHQLGLHHDELFFRRNGFEEKLTGVEQPKVVEGILS